MFFELAKRNVLSPAGFPPFNVPAKQALNDEAPDVYSELDSGADVEPPKIIHEPINVGLSKSQNGRGRALNRTHSDSMSTKRAVNILLLIDDR